MGSIWAKIFRFLKTDIKEVMNSMKMYEKNIANRSYFRYYLGLLPRIKKYLKYECHRQIARIRGAQIGEDVIIPFKLAIKANKNLSIGAHSSIMTKQLDLRNPIIIGSHVIMGWSVKILTTSHEVDSPHFERKNCGLVIDDYAWLPAKILVLPSCRHIGYGAVVGAGSCVVKDVDRMSVVGGNPAREIKKRQQVHSDIPVESLQGGDFNAYRKTWSRRKEILNGN